MAAAAGDIQKVSANTKGTIDDAKQKDKKILLPSCTFEGVSLEEDTQKWIKTNYEELDVLLCKLIP
jgi:hypothetical protein